MNSKVALFQQNLSTTKAKELLECFLGGRNTRTLEAYRNDLLDFSRFNGEDFILNSMAVFISLSAGEANSVVLKYRNHLTECGLQANTINRRLAAIRSLVKMARLLGLIAWSIEVPNLKTEAYRDTNGPGQVAFQKMLSQVDGGNSPKLKRDYAILRLLYDLALRASELTSIDFEDFDPINGTIAIIGKGKTQKENLNLPPSTIVALDVWIKVRGGHSGALFTNFDRARKGERLTRAGLYQLVRKLGNHAGVKTRPHGLRHLSITAACKVAQANGMGLEEVLDHSRHSDVTVLMTYVDKERNVQGQIATMIAEAMDRRRRG